MRKKHYAHIVKWRDSATFTGWRPLKHDNHSVSEITSVGWVTLQTPKTVTMTTSISGCGSVMDAVTIPREAITKITRLKNYILGDE